MKKYLYSLAVLLMTAATTAFTSCSDDDDKEDIVYYYGITGGTFSSDGAEELATINQAYNMAFISAGLHAAQGRFVPNTPKDKIIAACQQAENGIRTSGLVVKYYYVYKVKDQHGDVIYSQTWGVRKTQYD